MRVRRVHAQTIEGFWSLVKRGIVASFHKVSKRYLPLYVAEFEFRYNNRMNPIIWYCDSRLLRRKKWRPPQG
jgi:hypothetical protein